MSEFTPAQQAFNEFVQEANENKQKLREANARLEAMTEALRSLRDACWYGSMEGKREEAEHALSLSGPDALAISEKKNRVVEAAKELQAAEDALSEWTKKHGYQPELGTENEVIMLRACDARQELSNALAALEVDKPEEVTPDGQARTD